MFSTTLHKLNYIFHLFSYLALKEDLQTPAAAGWSIAKASLFYFHNYNEKDMNKIKGPIIRFLSLAHDPYLAYLEFGQRIILAHEYMNRYRGGRLCTNAIEWFRPGNRQGFAKTKSMYKLLMKKRKEQPL